MRTLTMILSCLLVAGMMFYGAKEGFALIIERVPLSGKIVGLILDIMFFTLGTMLVFSTGLILYAGLFTGAETRFLLTTPARSDQIFATKFQAAALFSSAAFLVLGAPILFDALLSASADLLLGLRSDPGGIGSGRLFAAGQLLSEKTQRDAWSVDSVHRHTRSHLRLPCGCDGQRRRR
jgi:hypothetical protein